MKISIVIPAYEANGKGIELLDDLMNSIFNQTYKNLEIIVSDHSTDNLIKNYLESWKEKLNIIHIFTEKGRGNSSVNMNEGLKISDGEFIKIMHMDDKFCKDDALEIMVNNLTQNKKFKWGAFGFNHYYEKENCIKRNVVPEIYKNEKTQTYSLMGCPSVSFFINDKTNFFDEDMIIINDFDMHYRLNKKYGNPLIIPDISITIRMHDGQVSSFLPDYSNKENEEINLFLKKI